jgi:putative SOS response-associated peptidase YedK
MCGRYDLSSTPAAIRARFAVPEVPEFAPNPDLRPTDRAPIVRLARDGARECVLARWGLVPAWAKDLAYGSRCFNARAETAANLPSFRGAFRKRRCLVPVDAFYEWTGERGHKTKWRIAGDEPAPFALAGLWEWWRDPTLPESAAVETYTILTTAANAAIAPLHERMPVIVPAERHAEWLSAVGDAADLLAGVGAERVRISGPV